MRPALHSKTICFAALGLFVLAGALPARADESTIGKATAVVPAATYARGTEVADLSIDDPVVQDDLVKTSEKGSTQIKFVDGTVLTVGPGSEVKLDKAIFDGGNAKNVTVEVVRGAMRFASGHSDHSAYHIQTKVATIGVRGTVIDVSYDNDKMVYATVEGEAEVCNRNTGAGCRRVRAGDPALAITMNGFARATAREAGRLFRNLNGVSRVLTKQAAVMLKGTTRVVQGTGRAVGKTVKNVGDGVAHGLKRTLHFRPPF